MRVVLDTNILISACWKPGGLEDQLVELAIARRIQAIASPALWAEYVEVVHRPKFEKLRDRADLLLARLNPCLLSVDSLPTLQLAHDPDDNLLLECAAGGQADSLITGNLKDFPLDWPIARIVNARGFLDANPRIAHAPPAPCAAP
jgi:putative PIN family toxin of toxin-antitoxin system